MLTFDIFYNKDQKRDFRCEKDDELSKPFSDFATSEKKKIEDFFFYYKGSLIEIKKDEKIKDTIFGNSEKDKFKIFALPLTPLQIQKPVPKIIEPEFPGKKSVEPEPTNPTTEITVETKEEKKDEYEEQKPIRRKINKVYYNDIVCPKCETTAIIEKNELNLNVLNCENFHYLKDITFDTFDQFVYDYDNKDKEYIKKYRCNICGMPKDKLKVDKMYICSCGCRVCDECRNGLHKPESKDSKDNKGHFQVNIEDKNYYCLKHGAKNYVCYCLDCNANLCDDCKKEHETKQHEIIDFVSIKVNKDKVKELEEKAKGHKTILLDFIEITRLIFDKIINTIEDYLNSHIMIEKSLIRRYKNGQRNYQLLKNLKNQELFKNNLFKQMKDLNDTLPNRQIVEQKLKEQDFINNQFNFLFNKIYTPINQAKQKGEKKSVQKNDSSKRQLIVTYDIQGTQLDRRVKLFDPVFVENNKDNISMKISHLKKDIFNGSLMSEYRNNRDANQLEVILYEKNEVKDMSYMLNNCKYATNVDFTKWKMNNITSVEAMFQLCNIKKVTNLSMTDMKNLENARAMLCKCKTITDLDNWNDLGKWFNNKAEYKIRNLSMFYSGCINLKSISFTKSNAYLNQLVDISYMFNKCKSLTEVNHIFFISSPNINKICGLFNGCKGLTKISSKLSFKSNSIEDLSIMFQNCASLPSIETYFDNAKNIKYITGMFAGCKSVKKIYSYIYYTDNLINMGALCRGCSNLEALSDIGNYSKYNMSKVTNTKEMFLNCKKLKTVKGLNNYRFKEGTDFDSILKDIIVDKKENIKNDLLKNQVRSVEKSTINQ